MIGGIVISEKINISIYNKGNLYFAVAVKNGKIIRANLPKSSEKEALNEISREFDSYILSDEYKSFAESICKIYHGEAVYFENEVLNLDVGEFQEKVLLELMKIPYGEVKSYKQVADAIDSKAYRAVGTAIGKNPLALIIPCHRVIRSDYKVGGFYGGTEMKKEILENEGICIVNGKIKKVNKPI